MSQLKEFWNTFKNRKISYAQCGEDLIVEFLLQHSFQISKPTYLDIGANHPTHLSNSYLFYTKGAKGVCVEPDPTSHANIQRVRRRDTCLNIGVSGTVSGDLDFYVMSPSTLNTFSKADAERYQALENHKILNVIKVPCVPIGELLESYFPNGLDFMSLDTEGKDLEILQGINYQKNRPRVICVETLEYTTSHTPRKLTEIVDFLVSQQYVLYSDTYINTILVDSLVWNKR